MKLPGGERAVVDIGKLRDYCLSSTHPRGRHKARVFRTRLGLTEADATFLHGHLLKAARDGEAELANRDEYGQRYVLDFQLSGPAGEGTVRSSWMVLTREDFPRFTTCFVL